MKIQFKEIERVKVRTELTLEGALDAIITINYVGTIEFFNKAAEELWGIDRKDAIGNNVSILFSDDTIQNDDFVKSYITPGQEKIVGMRKEVQIKDNNGEEKPVLFLLSEAKIGDDHSYTAFIQNIEVELF
jgi:PAS domain S-box-containing protein